MSYNELLNAYLNLNKSSLNEESSRLLFMYLRRKGYLHQTNGKTSDLTERIELKADNGNYAIIDIDLVNNTIYVNEYNSHRDLVSITNFSNLRRIDIIRNKEEKSFVVSTDNLSILRYYNAKTLETNLSFLSTNFLKKETPINMIEDDFRVIDDEDLLFRLIQIEDYVYDIKTTLKREELKEQL